MTAVMWLVGAFMLAIDVVLGQPQLDRLGIVGILIMFGAVLLSLYPVRRS